MNVSAINKNYRWKLFLSMALAAVFIRLLWLVFTDNCYEGDAMARIQQAWQWRCHPTWLPSPDWMPLFHYVFGTVLWLFNEPFWVPRVVNVFIGVGSVLVYLKVVEKEFGYPVALYSSWWLVFYHTHIFMNGVVQAETLYILVALAAMYYLQKSMETESLAAIAIAALFLNMGSLLRFEGWVFVAVCTAWLYWRTGRVKHVLWLVALSVFVPVWEVYQMWQHTGDPLWGLTFSDLENARQYENYPITLLQRLFMFIIAFQPLLLFMLPVAFRSATQPKGWWIVAFVPVAIALYKLLTLSLQPTIRYFAFYALLLAPYTIDYILQKTKTAGYRLPYRFSLILLPSIVLLPVVAWLYSLDNLLQLPVGYKQSARFAQHNLQQARIMVDQDHHMLGNGWEAFALMPSADVNQPNSSGVVWRVSGRYWMGETFDSIRFDAAFQEIRPTHLVLLKDGYLNNYLRFSKLAEHYKQYSFVQVFNSGGYQIYQVHEP